MKSLLVKAGFPQAVGLCIGEDAVALSRVISTPLGPVEIGRQSEPVTAGQPAAAIARLLESHLGQIKARRLPLAIGVPMGQTYFATRPIQKVGDNPSPHVLLREALRSPNVTVGDMTVDVIKAQPDQRSVAGIVACDRKYLKRLLEVPQPFDVRLVRVEPAPCALLRTAASRHRARRAEKVVLRMFLSDTELLAVLVVKHLPVVWRLWKLPRGDEASVILSAVRSLMTVSEDCGVQSPLDVLMLHGRWDLSRLLDLEWIEQQVEAPIRWFEAPALEASQAAFGLALGCLVEQESSFDLARELKPRPSFRDLFPWRQAALQVVMVVVMGLLLADRCWCLSESFLTAQAQNAEHVWMTSMQDAQLQKEKQDLQQKVSAIHKFLDTRVTWTSYEREIAASMPPTVFLTSFEGVCELESAGKKKGGSKPAKAMVLRGAVLLAKDGSVPEQIDQVLNTLREHPRLKRDFPVVELADLKQVQHTGSEGPLTAFTIVCLPKGKPSKGP